MIHNLFCQKSVQSAQNLCSKQFNANMVFPFKAGRMKEMNHLSAALLCSPSLVVLVLLPITHRCTSLSTFSSALLSDRQRR